METTREDPFIKLFLSAYENGSWANAALVKPDALDRTNPAVDQIATRKADGKTLAIEHTIIEPFVGEKEDFAFFEAAFLEIEKDESLPIPGRWVQVFVPVGIMQNQPKKIARVAIVESIHRWIRANLRVVQEGASKCRCMIKGIPGKPPFDITLNLKVAPLQRGSAVGTGIVHVRRQQLDDSLNRVIEKALRKKVTKLANTAVDKRILLLERQHMNLYPESILAEIEQQRSAFPELANVHEIWILETIFYGTAFGGDYLRFELYENGTQIKSLDFKGGKLIMKSDHGIGEVIQEP